MSTISVSFVERRLVRLRRPWSAASRIGALCVLLGVAASARAVEARYIVYVDAGHARELNDGARREALIKRWEHQLGRSIHVERPLATGGWLLRVDAPGDTSDTAARIGALEGVGSVEIDAILRHQSTH